MNNKLEVSICIPSYEQPKNLQKCLESIEIQTFKDFEVIITDDSRSDDLKYIVDVFNKKFKIKYIKNSHPLGSPENWNESIRNALGKYIKILHHDDYFTKEESLEMMVSLMEKDPKNKVLFCSSRHVDNLFNYHSSHIISDIDMNKIQKNPNILFLGNLIGAPSVMMYHKDIKIYFDTRMKWLVDLDFYIKVLNNNKFVYITEELVSINIGEENRVTYQCENDKRINLYEHIILLEKLNFNRLPLSFKYFIAKLLLKFDVKSIEELNSISNSRFSDEFSKILFFSKIVKPFYNLLKRLKV